jgi:predicted RNA binding protein with dsRBD fold (UPF0201 family)
MKGAGMPEQTRLTEDEQVRKIIEKQKEQIRKIQAKDREKLKKLQVRLAKQRIERRALAGAELEKLYRANPAVVDVTKVAAICQKYWSLEKDPKRPLTTETAG